MAKDSLTRPCNVSLARLTGVDMAVAAKKPLVSVVIPSFNHANFIEECLLSVIHQSHDNLEIVLVDDGSTDDTVIVAERVLKASHRPFRVIRQVNQGAHSAINNGISTSRGDYLAILNSDDKYAEDRISKCLDILRASGSEFCFTKVSFLDENGKAVKLPDNSYAAKLSRSQNSIIRDISVGFSLLKANTALSTGNFLFSRSIFKSVGKFHDLKFCHDWDFILQSTLYSEPIYIDSPLYYYRMHESNAYKLLGKLAHEETKITLRRYLSVCDNRRFPNTKRPCHFKYGSYFDHFMFENNMYQHLNSLSNHSVE